MAVSGISILPVVDASSAVTQTDRDIARSMAEHVFLDGNSAMVAMLTALSSPNTKYLKVSRVELPE